MVRFFSTAFLLALLLPMAAAADTAGLQRALVVFKNQIGAGVSYVEYPNAVAALNTEIELAQRAGGIPTNASAELVKLQAGMQMVTLAWDLRFRLTRYQRGASREFAFCGGDLGQALAKTGAAFKDQGMLDADLKTEELGGQCAYYTSGAIGQLLSGLGRQADRSLDALVPPKKPPVRRR